MSYYTFPAREVKIGNFSFNETINYGKAVPTMIDNHFPHLLLQTTDPDAGDYYIGNMSQNYDGILFRQFEGMNNSVQAYFPLTDCADVAIEYADRSLEFKTEGNFLFKMN